MGAASSQLAFLDQADHDIGLLATTRSSIPTEQSELATYPNAAVFFRGAELRTGVGQFVRYVDGIHAIRYPGVVGEFVFRATLTTPDISKGRKVVADPYKTSGMFTQWHATPRQY